MLARAMATAFLVMSASCASSSPSPPARLTPARAAAVVVPALLSNGRVEITIAYAYTLGVRATIPIVIRATRGTITGPVAARVVATGMGGGGVPSEVLVRTLATESVVIRAGEIHSTSVSWDGRDEAGILVPGDAYVLVVEVQVDDGGRSSRANANATLQWNP